MKGEEGKGREGKGREGTHLVDKWHQERIGDEPWDVF